MDAHFIPVKLALEPVEPLTLERRKSAQRQVVPAPGPTAWGDGPKVKAPPLFPPYNMASQNITHIRTPLALHTVDLQADLPASPPRRPLFPQAPPCSLLLLAPCSGVTPGKPSPICNPTGVLPASSPKCVSVSRHFFNSVQNLAFPLPPRVHLRAQH